ncbi:MAG: tRNA (N(6)-L-threonylcarbamoyladenosine(37)-C(2))-methylthiotransferase MtaB [Bacilli bacterium]|nr:tRNA (N(6)-L-threonylcarbamoyladenosine(37)-C(2))-methylthiotransferase MtaB [Bacilli bacterium]
MKIFATSLGCKVNAYEARAITATFLKHGYQLGDLSHFDVALINTCTVTHVASQKSRQLIRKLRRNNPKAIIIVIGCFVINNANTIIKDCGADIIVSNNHYHEIYPLVNEFKKKQKKIIKVDSKATLRKLTKYEELGINQYTESTRAYVKISDGCDNFCSYCIIPLVRGKLRSRDPKQILCEVKTLIKQGYKEVVLTGIDTSSYGKEFKNYHLADLLNDILKNNPRLYRLRLSSIEISQIDDKFLRILKTYPNFANHLHLSLQSGSDTVLKRMNRKYTNKQFLDKVKAIRQVRKDIALTTDVIVGFPNESEKEFKETLSFLKKVKFSQIHAFPFSPREGTAAYLMKDVDIKIKNQRMRQLLKLNQTLKVNYLKQFYGQTLEVLFEEKNVGLTTNYLRVKGHYPANCIKKIRLNKNNVIA